MPFLGRGSYLKSRIPIGKNLKSGYSDFPVEQMWACFGSGAEEVAV